MLQQRWHPVDIFVACLAPPKLYTNAFHWWCTLRRGELGHSKHEDVGGVRTYVWQIFNTADKVLATLSSTWKCLVSMWGWNVASKRCLVSGNDIADCVKDKISMVARRPYLATSQASCSRIRLGHSLLERQENCPGLAARSSHWLPLVWGHRLRTIYELTRFLLVIIKRGSFFNWLGNGLSSWLYL